MAELIIRSDNADKIKQALHDQVLQALDECGVIAAKAAQQELTMSGAVDTGRLRGSIDYGVVEADQEMQVGTNVEYAPYVEFGTGCYSTVGGGTSKSSWLYQGDDGETHIGKPMPARPYLKPALEKNVQQFQQAFERNLKR